MAHFKKVESENSVKFKWIFPFKKTGQLRMYEDKCTKTPELKWGSKR